jgi:hypothetical protein
MFAGQQRRPAAAASSGGQQRRVDIIDAMLAAGLLPRQ